MERFNQRFGLQKLFSRGRWLACLAMLVLLKANVCMGAAVLHAGWCGGAGLRCQAWQPHLPSMATPTLLWATPTLIWATPTLIWQVEGGAHGDVKRAHAHAPHLHDANLTRRQEQFSDEERVARMLVSAVEFERMHAIPKHDIPKHAIPKHAIPKHDIPKHACRDEACMPCRNIRGATKW